MTVQLVNLRYIRCFSMIFFTVTTACVKKIPKMLRMDQCTSKLLLFLQGTLSIYPLPEDRNVPVPPRLFVDDRLPKAKPVDCIVRVYIVRVR